MDENSKGRSDFTRWIAVADWKWNDLMEEVEKRGGDPIVRHMLDSVDDDYINLWGRKVDGN